MLGAPSGMPARAESAGHNESTDGPKAMNRTKNKNSIEAYKTVPHVANKP
jgi:hypothetical protein